MTLKNLRPVDLYDLMDELDRLLNAVDFNAKPIAYRTGVRRMRTYLDHVASGLRMIQGGELEPHDIRHIHQHNRNFDL